MAELDNERDALRRAEAGIALSMRQPTVASRMDALRRDYDQAQDAEKDAMVSVIITRLALQPASRVRG